MAVAMLLISRWAGVLANDSPCTYRNGVQGSLRCEERRSSPVTTAQFLSNLKWQLWRRLVSSGVHFREHKDASALPEGVVSCRCHANCDEWRQMTMKTEKRK